MDGDDVVVTVTKFNEHAANTATVDAKRKLFLSPSLLFLLVTAEPVLDVVVEVNNEGDMVAIGNRCIPVVHVVDKARHVDDEDEDGVGCLCGPRNCTIVEEETAEDDVVPVVVEIDLLLKARHDDVNRAERVAVHAAQDAILISKQYV